MVDLAQLVERVGPILVFLVAMTFVAEVCDLAGLFDEAAHWAARAAAGRVALLWLLVVVLATGSTIVLSLDTTAVLLTPVAIAVARQVGAPPMPFAMTTLWLANTASLLLPVSNLSNLLALHPLGELGLGTRDYIALMAAPAVTAVLATVVVLWLLHRRDLGGHYTDPPRAEPHDHPLMLMTAGATVVLAVAFVAGIQPAIASTGAALLLFAATAWRAPELLRRVTMPWLTILGVAVLFLVIDAALKLGLEDYLRTVVGPGTGVTDLLRISGIGAASSNAINNLPAYLALEPTVADAPARLAALLVGVNAGPIVTLWGSVATLLWAQRCRSAGLTVSARRLGLTGLLCALVVVPAATLALAATA
ncbi:arsenic transporter [Intrasporangium oryzae NRRL B-24470]|uniref:Arsenic transporter n=1 Tax=Intrasporangium oryzae NRRL B-24470 TaxID=1386089 RepID=W9G8Z6_9MICO|nr:SLC13 family permease [Intrasporangium oryzae]EWT01732.1 arsenic transporter [Intrasporangium oryzae NRRL B-24470]